MKNNYKEYQSLFEMESDILHFWQKDKTFEKSLSKRQGKEIFSFYDGPPFITGTPHYATLLPSIAKDIIPRFQTMKGRYVRRRWGWDVHGLPIENQVEKELGIKNKREIEELGIDKFVSACRKYVNVGTEKWRWYVDRIGRWADMDNAYRTDSLEYMESVIWAFKQLYQKGLIYRGKRVSLYCTRCATPLSKFEVTMDEDSYKEIEDPAVTLKFKLIDEGSYLLAWTTTPWTLPANLALAVDEDAEYVKVTNGKELFIMAHEALSRYRDNDLEIKSYFKGKELIGKKYQPLYQFLPVNDAKDYHVVSAKFVSMEEGTGVVHIAPGFGEEDSLLGEQEGLSMLETVDSEGRFIKEVKPWANIYVKDADPMIIDDLQKRNLLFNEGRITHAYPHCHRCSKPLIYKAQESWYLRVDSVKSKMLANNKNIKWVPPHFGSGRFVYNIENAPDWCISRNRYWGTPIPVWVTEEGEEIVVGSISELEELSGEKITDLHRPFIDEVILQTQDGKKAKRVKEVLDGWFESGSMPYAQDHFPFENEKLFKDHYPCDFIIEYTGQLRGWFYYLHLLGNMLFGQNAFSQVAVTGVLMGNDGRKMSKSLGNYPDPRTTIEKYGAEALRLYFMESKIMSGEDTSISEEDIMEQYRLLNILHNSLKYFATYAKLHNYKPTKQIKDSDYILDRWIKLRSIELTCKIDQGLANLDFISATKAIRPFIEDLSTWYLRRSRERFVEGDISAFNTMDHVLKRFALSVAPILPFSAERIWQSLGERDSVHLQDYPDVSEIQVAEDSQLLKMMALVRKIASACHMIRSEVQINLRMPLSKLIIEGQNDLVGQAELIQLLSDEINVKSVEFGKVSDKLAKAVVEDKPIGLDTTLTKELKEEGQLREILRLIQQNRKNANLEVGQKATLFYWTDDELIEKIFTKNQQAIKEGAYISRIIKSADSQIIRGIDSLKLTLKADKN